jgi:hypothetical protein
MTWLSADDPLALLALSSGQVNTPTSNIGAAGVGAMDGDQASIVMGEPVPVVFGVRKNDGTGGVMLSPKASECRFQDVSGGAITAFYLLPLSQGQLNGVQVRDVFQSVCRVGTFTQAYGARAGTWTPGNVLAYQSVPSNTASAATTECGSVGFYPGVTTLSFQNAVPSGSTFWKKKINIFIRGGIWVTRLQDGTTAASDSFPDLVRWLMQQTSRVPDALIDSTTLTTADTFVRVNGLSCNGVISASGNLADFITQWARYFLLSESSIQGKRGLRPLLPINTDGTIKTTAITPVYVFDETLITPESFQVSYVSLADRLPFTCQVIWRQQQENDCGIIRTAEVSYSGTSGPKETHDLSQFCTSEAHAVKVGAYILARRYYVTHTCKFTAQPDSHNALLNPGDVIRVRMTRTPSQFFPSVHDYYYQIERITKNMQGVVTYECTHFPVDNNYCSLVALDVANVTPTGLVLPSNLTGTSCDLNSSTDTSVPTSTSSSGNSSVGSGAVSQATSGEGTQLPDPTANPADPLRDASVIAGSPFTYSEATNGTPTISGLTLCANGNTNPSATVTVSNNPTSTGGDPLLPAYSASVQTTSNEAANATSILLAAYIKGAPAGHYGTIQINYACSDKQTISAYGSVAATPKTIDRLQGYLVAWQDRGTYISYIRYGLQTVYFFGSPGASDYYTNLKLSEQAYVPTHYTGYTSGFELATIIYSDGSTRSVTTNGLSWPY